MKYKGSLHIARTKVEQWGKAFSYVDHHRNRRSFSWEKQTLVIIGMCFTSEYGSISLPLVLSKASLDLSQCVSRRFKCYTAMAYELACLVGSEQISMHKESSPQRLWMREKTWFLFTFPTFSIVIFLVWRLSNLYIDISTGRPCFLLKYLIFPKSRKPVSTFIIGLSWEPSSSRTSW